MLGGGYTRGGALRPGGGRGRMALGAAALGLMLAAGCTPTTNDQPEDTTVSTEQSRPGGERTSEQAGDGQPAGGAGEAGEQTGAGQERPTLDEATATMDAAIAALEPVLFAHIPADRWDERHEAYSTSCASADTVGRYASALYTSVGEYLTADMWPELEAVLTEHGFAARSELPLKSGNAMITFFNDVGDTITLSSTADSAYGPGGAGYGGETNCHEGYVWPRDRAN